MKKLDKLVLKAFIGPFILTVVVVVFILLTHFMIQRLDDLFGKGLSIGVIVELLFYFSLNLIPQALPLAVLLSSLITFGNLGEYSELTAVKSSGISLSRILRPAFIFVVMVSAADLWFDNAVVPKANLKAYSLLWDVTQKKPTVNLKEGLFYNGLQGFSIRVEKKGEDENLVGLMVYNHTDNRGNTNVLLADSGRMYSLDDGDYLVLDLRKGNRFAEYYERTGETQSDQRFLRQQFSKNKLVFSLKSFDLNRTKEEYFAGHQIMKNMKQLSVEADSIRRVVVQKGDDLQNEIKSYYVFHLKDKGMPAVRSDSTLLRSDDTLPFSIDSVDEELKKAVSKPTDLAQIDPDSINSDTVFMKYSPLLSDLQPEKVYSRIAGRLNDITDFITRKKDEVRGEKEKARSFEMVRWMKITMAFSCLVMFLIGAPLGAIVKKGGLGMPVLFSIIFFIIFYLTNIMGRKWANEELIYLSVGMWLPNIILLPIGFFFLIRARNDSSPIDFATYIVPIKRFINLFSRRRRTKS